MLVLLVGLELTSELDARVADIQNLQVNIESANMAISEAKSDVVQSLCKSNSLNAMIQNLKDTRMKIDASQIIYSTAALTVTVRES